LKKVDCEKPLFLRVSGQGGREKKKKATRGLKVCGEKSKCIKGKQKTGHDKFH